MTPFLMAPYRSQLVAWSALLGMAWLIGCSEPPADTDSAAAGTSIERMTAIEHPPDEPNAEEIFQARCAGCHADPDNNRAMPLHTLATLNPAHVVFALTNGPMKAQADGLEFDQLIELAGFITGNQAAYRPDAADFCTRTDLSTEAVIGRWGVDASNSGALPRGAATIDTRNVGSLELAWAFGLPDVANARSAPVVTRDTLFIAATSGHLFALDRTDGCIRWHEQTPAPPRTALTLGRSGQRPVLFFGDTAAHVNAVDAQTGRLIWRADATVSEHTLLTGASVQHQDRLIVPVSLYEVGLTTDPEYECCISHGAVLALDTGNGERLWTTPTTKSAELQGETTAGTRRWGPSGVPVWSTPTVDAKRGLVYVGTGQNASLPATAYSDSVLALDLETGQVIWHFQAIAGDAYNMACDQRPPGPNCPKWRGPDHDIGAAVVITRDLTGRERLIVGQKSGDLYALDPDDRGAVVWQTRVGAGSALGGVHWGLSVSDGRIFAPVADPPFPIPGYHPAPGLYAVAVDSGEPIWNTAVARGCETNLFEYFGREDLYPACPFYYGLSAAPLAVNDLVFAPALDGRIRAFAQADGTVRWSFATARAFETINDIDAHGGSIDVAGVQAAGNMLYAQSGYGQFGQLPGNLLLAFRLAGTDSATRPASGADGRPSPIPR